ncbi:uncharacterized protein GIQ15_03346 [Arthroderma uncinatum]|uniref:uncharacterized protein n=1 Tax=Arthroderma uncinatum TaxID=74035 RepID=UPI00144A7C7D|nr:uncharacterized protein GIQ15_03346 [Arthroderma uncinatum]KAF3484022.1 hypothetical protein GIQ15_03346 [Arthroderma uncinatum]
MSFPAIFRWFISTITSPHSEFPSLFSWLSPTPPSDPKAISYRQQQEKIINLLKGDSYTIPRLEECLKGWYMGVNPAYDNIKATEGEFLEKWIKRDNLREMAIKVDLTLCIACFFPRTTEEKLQVLFEKMAWSEEPMLTESAFNKFFAFDDDVDSFLTAEEFVKQEPAAFVKYWLDPNRSGPEPYVLPSCIIYRTVGPKLAMGWSEASKAQFQKTTIEYIDCLMEVSKQRETYLPSLEEYIEGRIINIGVYPTLDLIPYAADIEVSDEVLKHESLQTIRIMLTEYDLKDERHILGQERDSAVDYTVGLIEESYRIVNEAGTRLPKLEGKAKADLDTYIEQCKDQAAGSIYFHQYSPRYLPKSAFQGDKIVVQL